MIDEAKRTSEVTVGQSKEMDFLKKFFEILNDKPTHTSEIKVDKPNQPNWMNSKVFNITHQTLNTSKTKFK